MVDSLLQSLLYQHTSSTKTHDGVLGASPGTQVLTSLVANAVVISAPMLPPDMPPASVAGDYNQVRIRPVTENEQVTHSIKFFDGNSWRFAEHWRYPFTAFNRMLRKRILKVSSFYISKLREGEEAPTVDELRAIFDDPQRQQDADALLNSIVWNGYKIAGTRPFWLNKRGQLDAIVDTLGCPALFLTFSHADFHWNDQMRHIPGYEIWQAASQEDKMKLARKMLNSAPHIAAHWIYFRFNSFQTTVVRPKFRVVDFWDRWEWQARGGGHDHGFVWSKQDLLPYLDLENKESRDNFAAFWGYHISAINPSPPGDEDNPPSIDNRCLQADATQLPTWEYLTSVILRVQVHICAVIRCLRQKKQDRRSATREQVTDEVVAQVRQANQAFIAANRDFATGFTAAGMEQLSRASTLLANLQCRFYFSRPLRNSPTITKELNPKHWSFLPARNDKRLNPYQPTLHIGWKANLDISPCTNTFAVKTYIAKYCSKAEVKSKSFRELVGEILPHVSSGSPLLSLTVRLLNKLLAERDWSQHEIMHHLLGQPLVNSSRSVLAVDCRPEADQPRGYRLDESGAIMKGKSLLEKYKARTRHFETDQLTYFKWLTLCNHETHQARPRAQPRVLDYFPKYKPTTTTHEDWARMKIWLHHPFRNVAETLKVGETTYETYTEAYEQCKSTHDHDVYDYFGIEVLPPKDYDEFENADTGTHPLPFPPAAAEWE